MRTSVLISGLLLLLVANLLAFYGFQGRASGEGFTNYFLSNAGSTNAKPIGPFDGVNLEPVNKDSAWRYNHRMSLWRVTILLSSLAWIIFLCLRTTSQSPSAVEPALPVTMEAVFAPHLNRETLSTQEVEIERLRTVFKK